MFICTLDGGLVRGIQLMQWVQINVAIAFLARAVASPPSGAGGRGAERGCSGCTGCIRCIGCIECIG